MLDSLDLLVLRLQDEKLHAIKVEMSGVGNELLLGHSVKRIEQEGDRRVEQEAGQPLFPLRETRETHQLIFPKHIQ